MGAWYVGTMRVAEIRISYEVLEDFLNIPWKIHAVREDSIRKAISLFVTGPNLEEVDESMALPVIEGEYHCGGISDDGGREHPYIYWEK